MRMYVTYVPVAIHREKKKEKEKEKREPILIP
jgi:hypothetical protein